ncbi:hypothetical protein TWF281_006921 [Arthrobotrys megalospora]
MPPTFLTLPRELRDEIYSHLLIHPTPPTPTYLQTPISSRPKYKPVKLSTLSILRVNQQVHDEAAAVLYSSNTFSIWINIIADWTSSAEIKGGVKAIIAYSSPWEGFGYLFREKGEGEINLTYYPKGDLSTTLTQELPGTETAFPLSKRYTHLLRKVRVEIFEERTSPAWNIAYWPARKAAEGFNASVLLKPLVGRLSTALKDAGEKLKVEVIVYAALCSDPKTFMSGRWDEQEGFKEAVLIKPKVEEYKALIQTVWPLTRGSWRCVVKMPEELEEMFGKNTVGRVLEECDGGLGKEKDLWVGGQVGMREVYKWVRVNGRVFVVLKTLRCRS